MRRRHGRPVKFITPEQQAARYVLQDHEIRGPLEILAGDAARAAVATAARELQDVPITPRHGILSARVARALETNVVYVFVNSTRSRAANYGLW